MTVFDLAAKLTLDTKGYESNLNDAEGKTSKFGDKLKSGLANATKIVGAAAVATVSAAAAGFTKLATSVTQNYAAFEQLEGGIETLFGDSAQKVLDDASAAFQTAGMSMNEYMETSIQSAASLINSLGGDQAKAAEMMNMSITDMADNVNKMGTSMEAVQNAYRGFSRGNFTMLDNLALGFAGTKEGMQQLLDKAEEISGVKYDISSYADIVNAIHVVQTEMGITGTTMKEASQTIEGAISSTKSAWQNFLTGLGDSRADMGKLSRELVSSATNVVKNILPVVKNIVAALPEAITSLVQAIQDEGILNDILTAAKDIFTALMEQVPNLMGQIFSAVIDMLPGILEMLPTIMENVFALLTGVITAIVDALPDLIRIIGEVLPDVIRTLAKALPQIIDAILSGLPDIIAAICEALPEIIFAIIEVLPELIGKIAESVLTNFPKILEAVFSGLVTILAKIGEWFAGLIGFVDEKGNGIGDDIAKWFSDLWNNIGQWFSDIFNNISRFFWDIYFKVTGALNDVWSKITGWFSDLWNKIGGFIKSAVEWGRDLLVNMWNGISEKVTWIWNQISGWFASLWDNIGKKINEAISWGKNLVTGLWNGISQSASWLWEKVSGWIGGLWDGIKNFFGIHSPSREMAWAGRMLVEGFGGGIEKYGDEAVDAALGVANEVKDAFSGDLSTQGVSYSVGRVQGGMSGLFGMLVEAFKEAIKQVRIELDEEEMGRFVDKTTTRLVYS